MMNTAQDFTKFFGQIPAGFQFDGSAATDAMKIWATFGERLSGIALEAATSSNEIATASAKETFARLGDATKLREEPSEYAQAAANFAQGQFELSRRTAEAFVGIMQRANSDTVALVAATGQSTTDQGAAGAASNATMPAAKTKRAAKAAR